MNLFTNKFGLILLICALILIENIIHFSCDETKTFVVTRVEDTSEQIMGFGLANIFKKFSPKTEIILPNCGEVGISNFIVGGIAANNHEFPFIALILFNGKTSCGGTILNQEWVITAAHCFKELENLNLNLQTNANKQYFYNIEKIDESFIHYNHSRENMMTSFSISVGSNSVNDRDIYGITKIVVHKKFNFETMNSDIALAKVDRKFRISAFVNGICLPTQKQEEPTGVLTVAGWGRLKFGQNASQTLQKVNLPIITDQQCSNMYSEKQVTIYRSNVCTFIKGQDSCEGDSGGPGFQYMNGKATLIGIVSFGWECASAYPGVNTQVSYFLDWIKEHAR